MSRVHLVWNNWVPVGSPFELSELLGIYDDYHKAHVRLIELVSLTEQPAGDVEDVVYIQQPHCEINYYYIEDREVE